MYIFFVKLTFLLWLIARTQGESYLCFSTSLASSVEVKCELNLLHSLCKMALWNWSAAVSFWPQILVLIHFLWVGDTVSFLLRSSCTLSQQQYHSHPFHHLHVNTCLYRLDAKVFSCHGRAVLLQRRHILCGSAKPVSSACPTSRKMQKIFPPAQSSRTVPVGSLAILGKGLREFSWEIDFSFFFKVDQNAEIVKLSNLQV